MDTQAKDNPVLRDATAHQNVVDALWRVANMRATREPGSWFLLAELARLEQVGRIG